MTKCATCGVPYTSFTDYQLHIVLKHQGVRKYVPLSREEKMRQVVAGEKRIGLHYFLGYGCL